MTLAELMKPVLARDLGNGPHRAFGSALDARTDQRIETPELITERLIRPRSMGPCKLCGERRFICDCVVSPSTVLQER